MDIFEEDTLSLISAFNKNKVRFILVGGLAVNYYGYSRTTGDLDLWLDDTLENRQKLVAALGDYGINGAEIFLDFPLIAGYAEVLMNNGIYLDIMADLTQFKQVDFNSCYEKASDCQPSEGIHLKVLHLNQLIAEKERNTRLKDQDDAEQLKRIAGLK